MRHLFRNSLAIVSLMLVSTGWDCSGASEGESSHLPEADRALIVAIAGDNVTFTWNSKTNHTYFIMYSDQVGKNSQWKSLPALQNLKGSGTQEILRLQIPNAQMYRYSLRVLVPKSRMRRWFK